MSVQTECRTWKLVFKSYAEVQPDFAKGNVSANRMQNLKTRFQKLCWDAAFIWLMQKYNANTPKSKFFGLLISHFESFPHPKIGIQPLIYGLSRAFSTREKKMKSGYNMLSHADSQNVRSSNVWPPQNVTALTHIFATEPQKALTANTMNVCSEGFWFAGTKCPFQWSHLNFYEFQDLP